VDLEREAEVLILIANMAFVLGARFDWSSPMSRLLL
jgi:hypothetical protein